METIGKMASKSNYLALVRRDEVIELFKNGSIYPASVIQFNGSIESLPQRTKEVEKIFNKMPDIEYSINYFLLYAVSESKPGTKGLNIQDLSAIIPLDEDSARMGLNLSPSVRLANPIFESNFVEYQKKSAAENAKRGVNNIGQIFGFDDLIKSIKNFTVKKSLPSLVSLVLDEKGARQPQTIWEHLICYNRNQMYPNGIQGAFLDTMSVVNNFSKQCVDFKDQKQTTTGRKVVEYEHPTYNALLECVSSSANFVKAADKAYKDFWKICPLYFMLLNLFTDASEDGSVIMGMPIQRFVDSIVRNYDQNHLKPALCMLGITLGQTGTYKMLYAIKKSALPFLM